MIQNGELENLKDPKKWVVVNANKRILFFKNIQNYLLVLDVFFNKLNL